MKNGRSSIWKNLTLLILGAAGLGIWLAGACDTEDESQRSAGSIGVAADVQPRLNPNALEAIDHVPDGYAQAPGGSIWHLDCVHHVPDGAVIHSDLSVSLNGKTIARYTACTHPVYRLVKANSAASGAAAPAGGVVASGSGWVVNSRASVPSSYSTFTQMNSGYWIVPSTPPSNDGQTLFFFPSLMTAAPLVIVQTVLQWGHSAAGGGASWAYASWAANSAGALYISPLKAASVGDEMTGQLSMTANDTYNGTPRQWWQITSNDNSKSTSSTISAELQNPGWFTSAEAGVLEAYNVANCNDFPLGTSGSTYFSHPLLYAGYSYLDRNLVTPSWGIVLDWLFDNPPWTGPNCNFINSNVVASGAQGGDTTLDY